jgi:hypothetical protein
MLTILRQPLASVPFAAGKAPLVDMLRGVKTHAIYLRVRGTLVVSTAAAGNVAPEAYANILPQVRILEGGNPRIDVSGPLLNYLTNRNSRQAPTQSGLPAVGASLAVGSYTISADFRIDFADIFAAGDPAETAFVDVLPNVRTQLEVTWSTTNTGIGTANLSNISLSGLTVQPVQIYDASPGQAPLYIPRIYRGSSGAITAATTKFPVPVFPQGTNRVSGLIFRPVTSSVTDATVWNTPSGTFNFRGDRSKYWDSVEFQEAYNEYLQAREQPVASSLTYLDLNFRRFGKLSECYVGGQDQNPRLEADVTSSSSSVIEWYSLELEIVGGVTGKLPSGKA